jgi:hypothetical protein
MMEIFHFNILPAFGLVSNIELHKALAKANELLNEAIALEANRLGIVV